MSEHDEHDDVEAHAKRFHRSDEAEGSPASADIDQNDADEDDEPDVEAHAKRFH